jgi:hypothetical protein
MNERLTRDLSLRAIFDAIKALSKGKALGHDRVPMEFFQEFEREVAPTLLFAFSAMLRVGATSAHINKGIITFIPKSGDRARQNNWRPITLLRSIYKILAKTLVRRIQMDLTEIIRPNQTGFVEGRSILDNVFMAQEGLDWAEKKIKTWSFFFWISRKHLIESNGTFSSKPWTNWALAPLGSAGSPPYIGRPPPPSK